MIYGMPDRLRELRLERGYSQQLVAERIRSSQSEISRYEIGEKTPGVGRLIQLAVVYNCSLDYLAGRDSRKRPGGDDDSIRTGVIR